MTKPPRRSSITASFGALTADIKAARPSPPEQTTSVQAPAPSRVGAGVISVTHRAISDIRNERDRLQALLDAGAAGSVELTPDTIDPSPFPDRLPDDGDADFALFKQSFEAEGQRVPIQVRPHPTQAGRYQVIYGHRRLRAARELGRKIKALVIEMSDHDLAVSQGIENAGRQDLSWIERALFASRMEQAGIKPRDIKAALTIDDPELTRMRSVYRSVPLDLIEAIGRAPKIGRPRWGELAKLLTNDAAVDAARRTLSAGKVQKDSNERFQLVFSALSTKTPAQQPSDLEFTDRSGARLCKLRISSKELRMTLEGKRGAEFAAFLHDQMQELIDRFEAQAAGE
ncbi:chromosome partitioning protein, ParB family [Xaviernesmea oryzae]|uniref:Chromosome partitioning protein, ParB family n=1 Tax=Xaviernesmea oryzae TaxID=464029 RepID=A0A1X7FXC7_9HYPH|nr:plasmid partitioning protein RepB [Xaviernesmea oryzae]SMF60378.1 chromosome partitioning protein, ParB family [Xaviernesmea oryzae]